MDLVSVILPVHNGAATLEAAVRSSLNQTHEALELVVVDDGSDDATPALLRTWQRRDPRLRVFRLPNRQGVAAAFQFGLEQTQAKWIARMDADDLNHPRRLEAQLSLLQQRPDLAAVSCLVEIRKRGPTGTLRPADEGYQRFAAWLNELTSPEDIQAQRFVDQPVVNPTFLTPRTTLETYGGFRSHLPWAEDYDFWLRLLHHGARIGKVTEALFTWTDHGTRLTRTHHAYTQAAFIHCKAHHLSQLSAVREKGVALCGAGPIGKQLARALLNEGTQVHTFYEVHPRRIGETIHRAPVRSMEAWTPRTENSPIILGAVGQPGRRHHVRDLAIERGHTEGVDFFSVA